MGMHCSAICVPGTLTCMAMPCADLLEADAAHYSHIKDYQRLHDAILQHVCLATPALAAAFTDEAAAQQVSLRSMLPAVTRLLPPEAVA
jgi:hypothetical protein